MRFVTSGNLTDILQLLFILNLSTCINVYTQKVRQYITSKKRTNLNIIQKTSSTQPIYHHY